jgi:hypothetical protein
MSLFGSSIWAAEIGRAHVLNRATSDLSVADPLAGLDGRR